MNNDLQPCIVCAGWYLKERPKNQEYSRSRFSLDDQMEASLKEKDDHHAVIHPVQ